MTLAGGLDMTNRTQPKSRMWRRGWWAIGIALALPLALAPVSVAMPDSAASFTADAQIAPILSDPVATADGFTLTIDNFDPAASYSAHVMGSATAQAAVDGRTITVTDVADGEQPSVSVTATKNGLMVAGQVAASLPAPYQAPRPTPLTAPAEPHTPAPDISAHEVAAASILRAGVTVPVTPALSDLAMSVQAGTVTVELTAPARSADGERLIVAAADEMTVQVTGFAPHSTIEVWMFSTPVLLGTITASAQGTALVAATVPQATPPGRHRIIIVGADDSDNDIDIALEIEVSATSTALPDSAADTDAPTEDALDAVVDASGSSSGSDGAAVPVASTPRGAAQQASGATNAVVAPTAGVVEAVSGTDVRLAVLLLIVVAVAVAVIRLPRDPAAAMGRVGSAEPTALPAAAASEHSDPQL